MGEQSLISARHVNWINGRADLPQNREPQEFAFETDEGVKHITLKARNRQVLELLMRGPVYCASTVRISAAVFALRELGFDIETVNHSREVGGEIQNFGVYSLKSKAVSHNG